MQKTKEQISFNMQQVKNKDSKIERNMARDVEVTTRLESEGWTVFRFWGNEIKKNTAHCADIIEKAVHSK